MLTVRFFEDLELPAEESGRNNRVYRKVDVETSDVIEAIGIVQRYYGKDIRVQSVNPSRIFILRNDIGASFEVVDSRVKSY